MHDLQYTISTHWLSSQIWTTNMDTEIELWPRVWLRGSIAPRSALCTVVDSYIHENEPNLVGLCVIATTSQRQSSGLECGLGTV